LKPAANDAPPEMTPMMLNRFRRTALASLALSVTLMLSGCLEPAPPSTPPTSDTAARFLTMATFGSTQADIQHLVDLGYEGWLTEQFNTVPAESHWAYQDRGGPIGCFFCASVDAWAVMESFWNQAILGKDQLRQRVGLALLELFVVSTNTDAVLFHRSDALASYLDLLAANAFGNYRTLLEQVTLSPTMGHYLSMLQNAKEDPSTGRLPDENYGREVMQLFTIGKWMLNSDGTRMKDANGQDIPTYGQDEVMGMARALTGWSWSGPDTSAVRWVGDLDNGVPTRDWVKPMQPFEQYHSQLEAKIVGGTVIPAGTNARESLRIVLDTLFNHPNTPPFVATQLIKKLTTSNPSPAYVQRVADVFISNKNGVRGDMQSVIRAILFDAEVWDGTHLTNPNWGKPREPMIKVANVIRSLECKAASNVYQLQPIQSADYDIGQMPMMANSVFNFFQPDYAPPGEVADAGLTAPEFQIINTNTLPGFLNFTKNLLDYGVFGGTDENTLNCNFTRYASVATDGRVMAQAMARDLMGVPLQETVLQSVATTVATIPATNTEARIKAALTMVLASPDFNIQR